MRDIPWSLIQDFSAVAKLGSLSKAAKHLNTSQPTLSRQIAMLERKLQMTLFERSTQGLRITTAGEKLIETSLAMEQASDEFLRIASGAAMTLAGNIRISVNEVIGHYYLPKAIIEFNQHYPEVQVEIDVCNQPKSLHKRDADIALRMFRPVQPDLIAKRLPDIKLQLAASKTYLAKQKQPIDMQNIKQHKLIGFDRNTDFIKSVNQLDIPLSAKDFCLKTDFLPLQIELARNGGGLTITHENLIDQCDDLESIKLDLTLPSLEFWLVCHADVKHNRRIRIMMDFLSSYFETLLL